MNKFVIELTDRINELYKTYESYIWNGKNRRLAIVFQNNMTLTFYLYEDNELVDELHLSFDRKEYDLYKAICLRTFVISLGNVLVHKLEDEDAYYNDKHKPYLVVISKDKKINNLIDLILENQEKEIINYNTDIIKNTSSLVKRKVYDKNFLKQLDTRIRLSHEMLKWR